MIDIIKVAATFLFVLGFCAIILVRIVATIRGIRDSWHSR